MHHVHKQMQETQHQIVFYVDVLLLLLLMFRFIISQERYIIDIYFTIWCGFGLMIEIEETRAMCVVIFIWLLRYIYWKKCIKNKQRKYIKCLSENTFMPIKCKTKHNQFIIYCILFHKIVNLSLTAAITSIMCNIIVVVRDLLKRGAHGTSHAVQGEARHVGQVRVIWVDN